MRPREPNQLDPVEPRGRPPWEPAQVELLPAVLPQECHRDFNTDIPRAHFS
jgi:hypothetical protein